MKYVSIGASGITAPCVFVGTWAIGGTSMWGDNDNSESVKTLQHAISIGLNAIDTAAVYGYGLAEEIVGKAVEGHRHDVIIATKCGLRWNTDKGTLRFERDGHRTVINLTAEGIFYEVEESLRRLNTDYIDIYFTHWPSIPPFETPVEETMNALSELKKQGKIRAIGACNVTTEKLAEYRKYAEIDVIQNRYTMLDRRFAPLLPICEKQNIAFQAYSPLEMGLLTGKIGMDYVYRPNEVREANVWFKESNRRLALDMLDKFKPLLSKYGCTMAQLVIAYTVSRIPNMIAICGARKISQVDDNAGGASLTLDAEDIKYINAIVEAMPQKT